MVMLFVESRVPTVAWERGARSGCWTRCRRGG